MTPWFRKIHKWIGLLIGIQFVLWMASGVVMSLMDARIVAGKQFRVPKAAALPWPADARSPGAVLAAATRPVQTVSSGWLGERPIFRMVDKGGTWLVDAGNGRPIDIDGQLASQLAAASYSGPGQAGAPVLLERSPETRKHAGPVWKVDFQDAEDTSVYVSAQTGLVLEHRNSTWRWFDLLWMLHIMDYVEREDFNNPFVIGSAVGSLFLAISGVWLLVTSFNLREFIPSRWLGTHRLSVYSRDGFRLRILDARAGDTVFVAMARAGMPLPSNCGGGQSCGLCAVRFRGAAPPATAADREHLSFNKIESGYRLACNLNVADNLQVEVDGGAGLFVEHVATVTAVTAVTPLLREITLRSELRPGPEYHPGAFVQIMVPGYSFAPRDIAVPAHHAAHWDALGLPETTVNDGPLRRSYSLCCPVEQQDGQMSLLVRFMAGGKGSTYMYSLKCGDSVRFSGPFGNFAVKERPAEKVFIGGGAGMAPLRAMVRALLHGGASEPIHFWYGARSLLDAPYADEMAALAAQHPNFHWNLVLSDQAGAHHGWPTGLVHEVAHHAWLRDYPGLQGCDFYLCGPPAMLAATLQLLAGLGVDEERIAFDDFKV